MKAFELYTSRKTFYQCKGKIKCKSNLKASKLGICEEKYKNKPISFDCYNISFDLNKKWMLRKEDKDSNVNIVNTVQMIGAE